MTLVIQRAFVTAVFMAIAFLLMPPAGAQTRWQLNSCLSRDDALSPRLRIEGCTAAIEAEQYSGRELAAIYYHRGIGHAKKAQYDEAIADFDRAIKLDPGAAYAFVNRGATYTIMGRYDAASADFNQAIRLNPKYGVSYSNRGLAHVKT